MHESFVMFFQNLILFLFDNFNVLIKLSYRC